MTTGRRDDGDDDEVEAAEGALVGDAVSGAVLGVAVTAGVRVGGGVGWAPEQADSARMTTRPIARDAILTLVTYPVRTLRNSTALAT